jgi:hypothetical protein
VFDGEYLWLNAQPGVLVDSLVLVLLRLVRVVLRLGFLCDTLPQL